jgi:hypothetical protein
VAFAALDTVESVKRFSEESTHASVRQKSLPARRIGAPRPAGRRQSGQADSRMTLQKLMRLFRLMTKRQKEALFANTARAMQIVACYPQLQRGFMCVRAMGVNQA